MEVPLLDLRPQNDPLRPEIDAAVARTLDSGRFILGPEVSAFEQELADALGVSHAIGVSSGTDALLVSLMALEVGPGDEVITTAFSFFATAGVIARVGAKPVFVDIDPSSFNIDPEAARAAAGPGTKAVMPVHLFGRAAERLQVDVPVVEDAAQSIGANELCGSLACLSFFPSKNLGAFGDAGAVYTNDEELADRVRMLRAHGGRPKYVHHRIGGNFRLDALQAAVLRVKLPHLSEWTDARRANAARYRELFAEESAVPPEVILPQDTPQHIYNQFVIRAPRRDELREHMKAAGVHTEVYYPVPFHLQPCFEHLGYRRGALPESERAAEEALALPVYPGLSEEQQAHVVKSIGEFYAG